MKFKVYNKSHNLRRRVKSGGEKKNKQSERVACVGWLSRYRDQTFKVGALVFIETETVLRRIGQLGRRRAEIEQAAGWRNGF